jgi:adenylylsulfate kinase
MDSIELFSPQRNLGDPTGKVSHEERIQFLNQRGAVVWFTGLSGSGKSTIARAVERNLLREGYFTIVLDGDLLRMGLNKDLGFSPEDRKENIRRLTEVAKLIADAQGIVLTAFISPYREDRDQARRYIGSDRFFEVYCSAPLEICENRDPKGLYKKARAGLIPEFTGISAPYEFPLNPELELDTSILSVEECVLRVYTSLKEKGFLGKKGRSEPSGP